MKKMNRYLTMLATAGALAAGGFAWAQTTDANAPPPKSSTPGAGCTATGNAMAAGNLGGNATNKDCNTTGTTAATTTTGATAAAPAAAPAPATAAAPSTSTNDVAAAPAPSDNAPKRVARADRG
jgi:hypothetical protein